MAGAADLAIFEGAVQQVCTEMDSTLERTAFSPIISESVDRASGMYDPEHGGVIAQGREGLPIFVGVMQYSVGEFIKQAVPQEPGDVFVMNDPYLGGSHLMDVRLIAPFHLEGTLVCYLANTGHWADIGGRVAGGFGAEARTIHEEGLRIGPTLIARGGEIERGVWQMILNNVRVPSEREGDLLAQLGAIEVGRRRLTALIEGYGLESFSEHIDKLAAYSERVMRSHIAGAADGTYRASTAIDDDGIDFDPLRVECAIDVRGDEVKVDLEGSSPPCTGPLNAPASAARSGVLIGLMHLFPDIPINHGSHRPITINIPEDSFLNARYPSPVAGCASEVPARVIDAVIEALGQARRELTQGGAFATSANLTIHGWDREGDEYIMYFFAGGGYGGHPEGDGLSNAGTTVSMAQTSPIEMIEERYPLLFDRYELRDGSGGAGRYRGGLGIEFDVRLHAREAELSFLMDRGRFAPRGALGGEDGELLHVAVHHANGEVYVPPHLTKDQGIEFREGDVVRVKTPGGGGFGPSEERDPASVERDRRGGYVLSEPARDNERRSQ